MARRRLSGQPHRADREGAGRAALWHLGDTDIFSDMALISEIHQPKVALVPIGDRFTMGPKTAALAVRRFLNVETVCRAITPPSAAGCRMPPASWRRWKAIR